MGATYVRSDESPSVATIHAYVRVDLGLHHIFLLILLLVYAYYMFRIKAEIKDFNILKVPR